MSINKVLNNIPQSLTTAEKQQARSNIDAAKETLVYIPSVTSWTGDLKFQYDNNTDTYDTYINNQSLGTIVPEPSATGTVLTCDTDGLVKWGQNSPFKTVTLYSTSNENNETLRDKEGIMPNFSEFYGTVSFTTTVAGSYSIVPLDYQYNLIHSDQCVNLTGQPANQTNQYCFAFKTSTPGDIKYVGIKGANSDGVVNITHLAGIYKE